MAEVTDMLSKLTSNAYLTAIEKGLDGSALRAKVLANNMANVNTPGFKRSDVSFSRDISELLRGDGFSGKVSRPMHIPIRVSQLAQFNAEASLEEEYSYRNDDNNVDMDVEVAQVSKNALYFQALAKKAQGYFQNLSEVINKGGQQ